METDQKALHLAGYLTLSGMLYTLITQNQKGKPLSPDEAKQAFIDGEKIFVNRIEQAAGEYTKLLQRKQDDKDQ